MIAIAMGATISLAHFAWLVAILEYSRMAIISSIPFSFYWVKYPI